MGDTIGTMIIMKVYRHSRKLTMVIQLSDPSEYEGGQLELSRISKYQNRKDW